jgi:hypothetical protein
MDWSSANGCCIYNYSLNTPITGGIIRLKCSFNSSFINETNYQVKHHIALARGEVITVDVNELTITPDTFTDGHTTVTIVVPEDATYDTIYVSAVEAFTCTILYNAYCVGDIYLNFHKNQIDIKTNEGWKTGIAGYKKIGNKWRKVTSIYSRTDGEYRGFDICTHSWVPSGLVTGIGGNHNENLYTCTKCGSERYDVIHVYTDGVCTICGKIKPI